MSIGTRIASVRGFRRMTQDQLGGLVGVTKQTVSGWERDRRTPDADDLVNLCRALNCSVDYLPGAAHDANGLTWDVVGGGLLVRVALAA